MKLIDRHEFTNGKAFETYYLDAEDIARHNLPECDVIGFCYDDERRGTQLFAMRPDEALIQARLLVDAVYKVSEGYEVGQPKTVIEQACEKWMSNTLGGLNQPLPDIDDDDDETKAAEAFAERAWSGNG